MKPFRIKIRRDIGLKVKPECEKLDGMIHNFEYGWKQVESDTYPGETAMIPEREGWPKDAPIWISSGDLVEIAKPTIHLIAREGVVIDINGNIKSWGRTDD